MFLFLHQSFALVNNLIIPIVYIICWIAETSEESTDPLSIAELYVNMRLALTMRDAAKILILSSVEMFEEVSRM